MDEAWTAISPAMLGVVLDEPDPGRCELARCLLALPCLPLRRAPSDPRVGCRSPGVRPWRDWGETIAARGFSDEPTGRYARSLRRLPRRIGEFLSGS
jgi:hypothetical protein